MHARQRTRCESALIHAERRGRKPVKQSRKDRTIVQDCREFFHRLIVNLKSAAI